MRNIFSHEHGLQDSHKLGSIMLREKFLLHYEGAENQEPTQAYGWARRDEKVQLGLMYFCRRKVGGCSVTAMLRSEVEGDG